ncbi:MAG TPA: hypothetical protein VNX28_03795 [Gemmataceae bacterium]|jgi:hypothetical protein|nr:hypothetical protein [Gemmataceae bacterium]
MKSNAILGVGFLVSAVVILGFGPRARAQANQWGNVKGTIVWGGKDLPKQLPLPQVAGSPDKAACTMGGHVVVSEDYVVNPKNKGLRWTFVWLANNDVANKEPLPIHPDLKALKVKKVVLDQPLCAFIPHALAMREGQDLVAKNSANIAHNLKWTGVANPGGNVLIPAGGSLDVKGLVADLRFPVKLECNIHPWMNGWLRIFPHPYYAVTDADGAFEIKDAPAGPHRLMVWNGTDGWLGGAKGKTGTPINIKAGATVDLGSLNFPPPS